MTERTVSPSERMEAIRRRIRERRAQSESFVSNYEIMKVQTRELFLRYDSSRMQDRFGLEGNEDFLYLNFTGRRYRVGRRNGVVSWQRSEGQWHEAGFNDTMTIYDVLADSKENCRLSGVFCGVNSLKGIVQTGGMNVGSGLFRRSEQRLAHRCEELREACLTLGGTEDTGVKVNADVCMRIPLFDFLPVVLQFWDSDDEFPAKLSLLFDENILDYMKYETTWYAMGFLMDRILAVMDGDDS